MSEPGSLEIPYPRETDCGRFGSAEPLSPWRRPTSTSLLWNLWMFELPGVVEGGMSVGNGKQKPGTARGSPRRSRTAKAVHINRRAMKLCCACEWGGWGRLSVDGSGHYNPNRSEDPWSRAICIARMAVLHRAGDLRLRAEDPCCYGGHEGWRQT